MVSELQAARVDKLHPAIAKFNGEWVWQALPPASASR